MKHEYYKKGTMKKVLAVNLIEGDLGIKTVCDLSNQHKPCPNKGFIVTEETYYTPDQFIENFTEITKTVDNDIYWAIDKIKNGVKVARSSWVRRIYMCIDNDILVIKSAYVNKQYPLSITDMIATDWEIYKEEVEECHDIKWAAKKIMEGCSVKRKNWDCKSIYYDHNFARVCLMSDNNITHTWCPTLDDLNATDYILEL